MQHGQRLGTTLSNSQSWFALTLRFALGISELILNNSILQSKNRAFSSHPGRLGGGSRAPIGQSRFPNCFLCQLGGARHEVVHARTPAHLRSQRSQLLGQMQNFSWRQGLTRDCDEGRRARVGASLWQLHSLRANITGGGVKARGGERANS